MDGYTICSKNITAWGNGDEGRWIMMRGGVGGKSMVTGMAVTKRKRRTTTTLLVSIIRVAMWCGRVRHDEEERGKCGDRYQRATDNVVVVSEEEGKAASMKYKGGAPPEL